MITSELIITISAFLLIYGYILYPVILILISGFINKPVKYSKGFSPEITILISAYNEENLISDAIHSIFKCDYPTEKIKIIVGSDGSTDQTVEILDNLSKTYTGLRYHNFERSGKNKIINEITALAKTDYVCYMDADCRVQKGVIQKLIGNFADESVGVAIASMNSIGSGENSSGGAGELLYQKIEKNFRINESKISSTVNSLGAFYVVRRDILKPIPNDSIADDYYPIILALLKKLRVLFINEAEVIEVRGKSTGDEFNRRIRASSASMAGLWEGKKLLLPNYGWVSFFLWSHKILRWMAPVFIILILIFTFFIKNHNIFFLIVLIPQICLYFGAIIGFLFEKFSKRFFPVKIAVYSVSMALGLALAICRFISGRKNAVWQR